MLGWMPRRADTATVPMIPTSRLTANERRVPMKVISRTRTGIAYQLGGRGVGGMILGYTMPRFAHGTELRSVLGYGVIAKLWIVQNSQCCRILQHGPIKQRVG